MMMIAITVCFLKLRVSPLYILWLCGCLFPCPEISWIILQEVNSWRISSRILKNCSRILKLSNLRARKQTTALWSVLDEGYTEDQKSSLYLLPPPRPRSRSRDLVMLLDLVQHWIYKTNEAKCVSIHFIVSLIQERKSFVAKVWFFSLSTGCETFVYQLIFFTRGKSC